MKVKQSGPSCSKLTMSLVNDLLKFTSRAQMFYQGQITQEIMYQVGPK